MTACPACGHDLQPPTLLSGPLAMFDGSTQTGVMWLWQTTGTEGKYEAVIMPFADAEGPYRHGLYGEDRTLIRELDPIPRYEAQHAGIPAAPLFTATLPPSGDPLPDAVAGSEFWAPFA
jgi:hypothetical protein